MQNKKMKKMKNEKMHRERDDTSSSSGTVGRATYNEILFKCKTVVGCTLSQPPVFHGIGRVTLTERIQHVAKQPPWRTKNARLACMYELNVNVVVANQSILGTRHSGGATTLSFFVEGANAVGSFVLRSIISGIMLVPPDDTVCSIKKVVCCVFSPIFFCQFIINHGVLSQTTLQIGNTHGYNVRRQKCCLSRASGVIVVASGPSMVSVVFRLVRSWLFVQQWLLVASVCRTVG